MLRGRQLPASRSSIRAAPALEIYSNSSTDSHSNNQEEPDLWFLLDGLPLPCTAEHLMGLFCNAPKWVDEPAFPFGKGYSWIVVHGLQNARLILDRIATLLQRGVMLRVHLFAMARQATLLGCNCALLNCRRDHAEYPEALGYRAVNSQIGWIDISEAAIPYLPLGTPFRRTNSGTILVRAVPDAAEPQRWLPDFMVLPHAVAGEQDGSAKGASIATVISNACSAVATNESQPLGPDIICSTSTTYSPLDAEPRAIFIFGVRNSSSLQDLAIYLEAAGTLNHLERRSGSTTQAGKATAVYSSSHEARRAALSNCSTIAAGTAASFL